MMVINDTSKRLKKFQDLAVKSSQRAINKPVTEMLYQFQDPSSSSTKSSIKYFWEEYFCIVMILSISECLLVLSPFTFYL